jgi:hypothetical protein
MFKIYSLFFAALLLLVSCSGEDKTVTKSHADSENETNDSSLVQVDSVVTENKLIPCSNDSLNALAEIMAGQNTGKSFLSFVSQSNSFKSFQKTFDKRWHTFDSTRLTNLKKFSSDEINSVIKTENTLFYPFSGPDILHAQTFFPTAHQYIMIGLEPVGSLPVFKEDEVDSLNLYFNKINTSLNAILKFSFFRTESMSKDLKNTEVDGTIHLICLFLKRTGNQLCSVKPVTVDTNGVLSYVDDFDKLKKMNVYTKGVEIHFTDVNHEPKKVIYYSVNAVDVSLNKNKGFKKYLENLGNVTTYLKGASYLMHKSYFSTIRNFILNNSSQVVQDDSGIAFHYFDESSHQWDYKFYGQYTKPIPMFSAFYQKDLDSTYKVIGSKPIGFGIGYNFKDKNSNFMIAIKKAG